MVFTSVVREKCMICFWQHSIHHHLAAQNFWGQVCCVMALWFTGTVCVEHTIYTLRLYGVCVCEYEVLYFRLAQWREQWTKGQVSLMV